MSLPTLEEFLAQKKKYPRNSYIDEPGFKSLYIRRSTRKINGTLYDVIDLANAEAEHPGKGAFTRLVHKLHDGYPKLGIYAESVINVPIRAKLLALGFEYVGPCEESPCYFLAPRGEIQNE